VRCRLGEKGARNDCNASPRPVRGATTNGRGHNASPTNNKLVALNQIFCGGQLVKGSGRELQVKTGTDGPHCRSCPQKQNTAERPKKIDFLGQIFFFGEGAQASEVEQQETRGSSFPLLGLPRACPVEDATTEVFGVCWKR